MATETPNTATLLASTTRRPHLTGEQRAELSNMIGTDLNSAAEVLLCVAGIVVAIEDDFVIGQELGSLVRTAVARLKDRARARATA